MSSVDRRSRPFRSCDAERRPLVILLIVLLATCASLAAQHRFAPVTKNAVPFRDPPLGSALLADFDGNGRLDVLDRGLLFTNQNGAFVAWPVALTGLTYGLATHDFDGDGRPDVLHGDYPSGPSANSLRIALNRLPTGFVPGGLNASSLPGTVDAHAIADFDGDGDLDLVLFPYSSSQAPRQFANDGLGNFTDVSAARMPTSHIGTAAAWVLDVDHDGDRDLVGPGSTSNQIGWMENVGSGVLAAPVTTGFPVGYGLVLGTFDADGDGAQELVIDNGALLVRTLSGYVPLPGVFPPMTGPRSYHAADFDGDSDLDVWVEGFYGGGYFENAGNVTFVDRRNPPIWRGAIDAAITDVDGDGRLDILAATNRIEILLGQPAAQFADVTRWPLVGECYGDFDGDGLTDHLYSLFMSTRLRKSIGAGDYVESPSVPPWISAYHATVDLEGDGDLDVVGSGNTGAMGFWRNDGVGNFTATFPMLGPFTYVTGVEFVAPGDVDGDGDLDLVVHFDPANSPPEVLLFENQGAGAFAVKASWTVAGLQGRVFEGVLFDADGDHDPDLVVSESNLELYANDGTGHLSFVAGAFPALATQWPAKLLAGDVDGDADVDLLAYYRTGSYAATDAALLRNGGAGAFSVALVFTESTQWRSLDLVDADEDGDLDFVVSTRSTTATSRVEVRSNNGSGGFSLASNGVAAVTSLELYYGASQFVDVDDDGDVDIVGTRNQSVIVCNQTRHLRAVNQPRLGGSFDVEFAHPEPPTARVVAFLISTRRLLPPLTFPGMGPIVVDPAVGVLLFASGTAAIPLSIALPANPAFLGLNLFAQGALLSGASIATSNAIHEQVIL